jgi:hypothetical protein
MADPPPVPAPVVAPVPPADPVAPPVAADPVVPPAADPPADPPAAPMDWAARRAEMAAGDAGLLKIMERYSDEKAFAKAHKQLVDKQLSGELKSAKPPANATEEQMAVWRKQAGVPDSPEGYELEMPKGFKPTDEITAVLDDFKKHAHKSNMPAEVVKASAEWYLAKEAATLQARAEQDTAFQETAEETLRSQWGSEYKQNMAAVKSMFGGNEEIFGLLMAGRAADGSVIGDNPKLLSFMLNLGLSANPNIRQYAGDGRMTETSVVAELKEIGALIQDGSQKYYGDPEKQKRFRDLAAFADARGLKWN